MKINWGSSVLSVCALLVATNYAQAWESLTGNWCNEDKGCTHWWTLYRVEVERQPTADPKSYQMMISYRYPEKRTPVFKGSIREQEFVLRGEIKGLGTFESAIDQELQKQIIRPLSLKDLQLVGPLKKDGAISEIPFKGAASGIIQGTISGKIKVEGVSAGGETVEFPFEGKFHEKIKPIISGLYTPPPGNCGGQQRSIPVDVRVEPQEKLEDEAKNARDAEAKQRPARTLEASRDAKKEEVDLPGKFGRWVEGTVTPDGKIHLILPALPVLDHKCIVQDVSTPGPLKLIRQDRPKL